MVACDLDGTLLRSDGTVDERTRRALAGVEADGAALVLCTARPTRWIRPIAEMIDHTGIAICANGAVVWDLHTETVLEEMPVSVEVAREVVRLLAEALPGGAWAVERARGFGREPAYQSRWPVPADTMVDAIDELIREPAVKLMLRHQDISADGLLARAREVVGHLVELSHSSTADSLLEISAFGVTKATTLAQLCAERHIRSEAVLAFGDMPNDLPMLLWSGHGVAVANAHPDVLAAAEEVTASNDEDGVAMVLERVFGPETVGAL